MAENPFYNYGILRPRSGAGVMDAPGGAMWSPGTGTIAATDNPFTSEGVLDGISPMNILAAPFLPLRIANSLFNTPAALKQQVGNATNALYASLPDPGSEEGAYQQRAAVDWALGSAGWLAGTPLAMAPERALMQDGAMRSGGGWLDMLPQEKLKKQIEPLVPKEHKAELFTAENPTEVNNILEKYSTDGSVDYKTWADDAWAHFNDHLEKQAKNGKGYSGEPQLGWLNAPEQAPLKKKLTDIWGDEEVAGLLGKDEHEVHYDISKSNDPVSMQLYDNHIADQAHDNWLWKSDQAPLLSKLEIYHPDEMDEFHGLTTASQVQKKSEKLLHKNWDKLDYFLEQHGSNVGLSPSDSPTMSYIANKIMHSDKSKFSPLADILDEGDMGMLGKFVNSHPDAPNIWADFMQHKKAHDEVVKAFDVAHGDTSSFPWLKQTENSALDNELVKSLPFTVYSNIANHGTKEEVQAALTDHLATQHNKFNATLPDNHPSPYKTQEWSDYMSAMNALNNVNASDKWAKSIPYVSTPPKSAPPHSVVDLELANNAPNPHEKLPTTTWEGPGAFQAYHVTPHNFDPQIGRPLGEFNLSKLRSGEGNLDYGHGFHFAENPGTRDFYMNTLGRGGKAPDSLVVGMRPNKDELLDWDASVKKQPPKVQPIVDKIMAGLAINRDMTGGQLYNHLAEKYYHGDIGSASKTFDLYGIPGHKYLDAGSRELEEGDPARTYNFLMYNPRDLKVLSRNNIPDERMFEPVNHDPFQPLDVSAAAAVQPKRGAYTFNVPEEAQKPLKEFLSNGYDRLRDPETGKPIVWWHVDKSTGPYTYERGKNEDYNFFKSPRGGTSLSANPQFGKVWGGTNLQGQAYYPVIVRAKHVGDYRNPADVEKVARYYLDRDTDRWGPGNAATLYNNLRAGDWELWEDERQHAKMLHDLGFDAVHMLEDGEKYFNLFVPDGQNIKTLFNKSFKFGKPMHLSGGAGAWTSLPIDHDPFEDKKKKPRGGQN